MFIIITISYYYVYAGHEREPCEKGWTDRDAVWAVDTWGQGTMRRGRDHPGDKIRLRNISWPM